MNIKELYESLSLVLQRLAVLETKMELITWLLAIVGTTVVGSITSRFVVYMKKKNGG